MKKLSIAMAILLSVACASAAQAADYVLGSFEGTTLVDGWSDWGGLATFANSTTGNTVGNESIKVFPAALGYYQGLAVKLQNKPDNVASFDAFMNNTHIAVDVTWDAADWDWNDSGWNGARILMYYNELGGGFNELGDPLDTFKVPNSDTGNPTNPGFWDLTNYPGDDEPNHNSGIHTRTMMWDYSSFLPLVTSTATADHTEFMLTTQAGNFVEPVAFYFDNIRFTTPVVLASDGDYDDDGDQDAADIDILWHIIRETGTDPNTPGVGVLNDTADLNGDTFANEDDVDLMLASKLTAGANLAYGDANLTGGTPELTDFNLWRTGTGGWAQGDFDGSGGTPELTDFNLWRTGPTVFPTTVGSHGGGGGAPLVPEPATLVLMGLALPVFVVAARRRKQRAEILEREATSEILWK